MDDELDVSKFSSSIWKKILKIILKQKWLLIGMMLIMVARSSLLGLLSVLNPMEVIFVWVNRARNMTSM